MKKTGEREKRILLVRNGERPKFLPRNKRDEEFFFVPPPPFFRGGGYRSGCRRYRSVNLLGFAPALATTGC
jgi:hypothetical protein